MKPTRDVVGPMLHSRSRALVLGVVVLAFSACGDLCNGCTEARKRVVGELLTAPDAATAETLVRERLATDVEVAKKICGVTVRGLAEIELKLDKGMLPGFYDLEIEAKPVLDPAHAADAATIASCSGVVKAFFDAKVDSDGVVTAYTLVSLDVQEVKTPGHEWKAPVEDHDWD